MAGGFNGSYNYLDGQEKLYNASGGVLLPGPYRSSCIYPIKKMTMNPYYYLFYRLNRFYNKKGNNELGPMFGVSILVAWNLSFFYRKCLFITKENFSGLNKYVFVLLLIFIYIINTILFYNKKRVNRIIEYYDKETQAKKKIGGWL